MQLLLVQLLVVLATLLIPLQETRWMLTLSQHNNQSSIPQIVGWVKEVFTLPWITPLFEELGIGCYPGTVLTFDWFLEMVLTMLLVVVVVGWFKDLFIGFILLWVFLTCIEFNGCESGLLVIMGGLVIIRGPGGLWGLGWGVNINWAWADLVLFNWLLPFLFTVSWKELFKIWQYFLTGVCLPVAWFTIATLGFPTSLIRLSNSSSVQWLAICGHSGGSMTGIH